MSAFPKARCGIAISSAPGLVAGLVLGTIGAVAPIATTASHAELRPQIAAPGQPGAQVSAVAGSRVPYQAYLVPDCIEGSNFCKFTSIATPARRRLDVHRIACQGWHGSATPPNFVTIAELRTAADAFVRRIDFLETTYTRVNTNSVWYISEQTLMFIPAGHMLRINLNSASTGVGSYGCAIFGEMVAPGA
jgi:hypothetical protein